MDLIVRSTEGGKGEIVHGMCSIGGCEMNIQPFTNLNEATEEAERLKGLGVKLETKRACPSCARELQGF